MLLLSLVLLFCVFLFFFFFQAEDGIRDRNVTGVQTCALPICSICATGLRGPDDTDGPGADRHWHPANRSASRSDGRPVDSVCSSVEPAYADASATECAFQRSWRRRAAWPGSLATPPILWI